MRLRLPASAPRERAGVSRSRPVDTSSPEVQDQQGWTRFPNRFPSTVTARNEGLDVGWSWYGGDVHVLDRVTSGPKPGLVEALGAKYHTGALSATRLSPNIVVECTGVARLVRDAADAAAPGGIVCLTGVGSPEAPSGGASTSLATDAVLKNLVVFGSVNANRRHYHRAAQVLRRADRSWLAQLITRYVQPEGFEQALEREPDDIKVVMEFAEP